MVKYYLLTKDLVETGQQLPYRVPNVVLMLKYCFYGLQFHTSYSLLIYKVTFVVTLTSTFLSLPINLKEMALMEVLAQSFLC